MIANLSRFTALLFGASLFLFCQQVTDYNVVKNNQALVKNNGGCGDGGNCIAVQLNASGPITSIEYSCEGEACRWVHPCPDGGKCGLYRAYEFEISGTTAVWYAWTNSGAPAVFKFKIHHQ